MAFQFMLDQGGRILDATINNANVHIISITRALREQENITDDLLIDLGRSEEVTNIALEMLTTRDTEIRQLRARIDRLEATLVSERLEHTKFRNEQNRQNTEWTTWFHRVKAVLPGLVTDTVTRLNDQVLGVLTSAPTPSAPTAPIAPPAPIAPQYQPTSVPMARQRAQRGHTVRPAILPPAPIPPAQWHQR